MKALTIFNPFAHLIITPQDELEDGLSQKRIENRTWHVNHRGPLLIHAGLSHAWMKLSEDGTEDEDYHIPLSQMVFGAVIGVVDAVDCVHIQRSKHGSIIQPEQSLIKYPWLKYHQHCEGPYGLVMLNARRFEHPIPFRGMQGLFNVPDEVVAEALEQVGFVSRV